MNNLHPKFMNKKAAIFTIDAILAVLIAGIMLSASYFYISNAGSAGESQSLYKISIDALAVLEKDGNLQNSANTGSASSISTFLNALPFQICSNITIYDNRSRMRLSAQKQGCSMSQPVYLRRVFVSNFSAYYAESKLSFD